MIRKICSIVLMLIFASGCAAGKIKSNTQLYEPARFNVNLVVIDSVSAEPPSREFLAMMKTAADKTRRAYNAEVGNDDVLYNLELTLDDLQAVGNANTADNVISIIAILRNPEDGDAYRTLPVRHQIFLSGVDESSEAQLLREALPKVFNGIYGLRQTPVSVLPVVYDPYLFDKKGTSRKKARNSNASLQPKSTQNVVVESDGEDGPKIISCAIC